MTCEDCKLSYQEFGIDATLSDSQWRLIHPEGSEGLLCANCMLKRASRLPGVIAARITFEISFSYIGKTVGGSFDETIKDGDRVI